MKSNVEITIDNLVHAIQGSKTLREQFLFRESLRNLVRLTRAEQTLEIKSSVSQLTRGATEHAAKHKAKINGMFKIAAADSDLLQRQLKFGDDHATGTVGHARAQGTRHDS